MPIPITTEDLKAALPDMTTTLNLHGLERPVELYRDRWGIPHIKAENEKDLFFAQGFATAQDRLWHMDADRHQALGRWSEFVGASGLARDRLLRAAGMGRTAKLDYEAASVAAKAMINAYTAGVNAFLDTTQTLPIEYKLLNQTPECWENWHCLAVYKFRNTLLGTFEPKLFQTNLTREIGAEKVAALIKGYPAGHLVTVPPGAVYEGPPLDGLAELQKAVAERWIGENHSPAPDEADFGSNACVISGKLTKSGLPMVAGDSHRALDTPNVYYQAHLSCPDFNIIGNSVPGMPGILHFCHNDYVAWGMTYGTADTQDLFIERFRDKPNGREYLFKEQWRPTEVLNETIKVRDAAPVEIAITITHHGPVIAGEPQEGVAVTISDPGLIDSSLWVDSVRDAMRSRSVDELHAAFRNWTDRVNNYAVADVHGNFGYLHEGKIPIRPEANGWRAVPGWTGEYEWNGYIPQDDLPHTINPQEGYAVTCNQRVASHDYPYYVGLYFAPEFRAKRIQSSILALKPGMATIDHMARFLADRISIPARILTPKLITASPLDADSEKAIALLRAWDYQMDRTLVQPTLYAKSKAILLRWLIEATLADAAESVLSETIGSQALTRQMALQMTLAIEQEDHSMFPVRPEGLFSATLQQAVAQLKETLGEEMSQWHWGRLHRTHPQHPLSAVFPDLANQLDPPSVPIHGDADTPLAGSYGLQNEFSVSGLSVNRYIHDPSDWGNSRWIVPLGASGHPGSPHYADQAQLWSNVEFIPQLWHWEQIQAEAESQQRLEPFPTIAICYDFDGTLIRGNMQENSFIPEIGMEKEVFWKEVNKHAKKYDMDEVLAYMQLMLKKARKKKVPFNKKSLTEHGKSVELFPGVEDWFEAIQKYANNKATIEHYIISSGLDEMIRGSSIGDKFKHIFASGFMYAPNGAADFPARSINYTTKVQYLFRINKGIENSWDNSEINQPTSEKKRPLPFSQMIYIGDGETDVPAMKMVNYKGGYSIAVYPPKKGDSTTQEEKTKKSNVEQLQKYNRCQFISEADYSKDKALYKIVISLIERIVNERKYKMNLDAK